MVSASALLSLAVLFTVCRVSISEKPRRAGVLVWALKSAMGVGGIKL
jgi:hypothetical protein